MSCLEKQGGKYQRWRVLTDVPGIEECEESTNGKKVVKLRKRRHLHGFELVEGPVGLVGRRLDI
jgi:hypothetical protein